MAAQLRLRQHRIIMQVILVLLTSCHRSESFPEGAPLEACSTMTPIHGDATADDFNPYLLSTFPTTYESGETIFGKCGCLSSARIYTHHDLYTLILGNSRNHKGKTLFFYKTADDC